MLRFYALAVAVVYLISVVTLILGIEPRMAFAAASGAVGGVLGGLLYIIRANTRRGQSSSS